MGFLSPWFLAGAAAVGLPLWLHLLRQFKRTPQPFSSLMFFERRVQSSVRHRKLRYLVLLALRVALIALLALAFANPFVNETASSASRRRMTVIAIDRSFSMRNRNHIELAKAEAHRIVNSLSGRSVAEVVALDARVETLTGSEFDKAPLNAAIDTVGATDSTSSFGEFARAVRVMEQRSGTDMDVHLISDMQQSAMPGGFSDLRLGPHTSLELHRIGTGKAANWAVETVVTSAHVYDPRKTHLTATIRGWQTSAAPRTVSLVFDGRVKESKEITVAANGRSQVEFTGFDIGYGAHRGKVQIQPDDDLAADDSFAFSVERSDPRRVLFLYANGRSSSGFYYKAAIESTQETGLLVQTASAEEADHTDFSRYAYVVLNDVGELDEHTAKSLCGYVGKGGSVLIVLGQATARAGRIPLSSERYSDFRQVQGAGYVDAQSPALSGSGGFDNVQFFEAARLPGQAGSRVLARLADGSPLVVEHPMGDGRVLIFASSLDNSTNDFPLHASYLPFAVQTGHYLARTEDAASSFVVGTSVPLRHTLGEASAADVIGPDGHRQLSLAQASTARSFDLSRSGFYEVQRPNASRVLIAANADRRESDLTTIPDETLDLWRNTGSTVSKARTGTVERQVQPRSLWQFVVILLFITSVVESIFASRYLKEKRETA